MPHRRRPRAHVCGGDCEGQTTRARQSSSAAVSVRRGVACTGHAISRDSYATSAAVIDNLRHLVEIRINLLGELIEMSPFLAELRRLMRSVQQFAVLPL